MGKELWQLWSFSKANQTGDVERGIRSRCSETTVRHIKNEEDADPPLERCTQLLQATWLEVTAERAKEQELNRAHPWWTRETMRHAYVSWRSHASQLRHRQQWLLRRSAHDHPAIADASEVWNAIDPSARDHGNESKHDWTDSKLAGHSWNGASQKIGRVNLARGTAEQKSLWEL